MFLVPRFLSWFFVFCFLFSVPCFLFSCLLFPESYFPHFVSCFLLAKSERKKTKWGKTTEIKFSEWRLGKKKEKTKKGSIKSPTRDAVKRRNETSNSFCRRKKKGNEIREKQCLLLTPTAFSLKWQIQKNAPRMGIRERRLKTCVGGYLILLYNLRHLTRVMGNDRDVCCVCAKHVEVEIERSH